MGEFTLQIIYPPAGSAGAALTTPPGPRCRAGPWEDPNAPRMLAFVPGDGDRAEALANRAIASRPENWNLVLAFDEETRFGNEWVPSQYGGHVRVISWIDGESYEGELIERARGYLPNGADKILDLSRLAMSESLQRRRQRIEDRLLSILKPGGYIERAIEPPAA